MATQPAAANNQLMIVKKNVVDVVAKKIRQFQDNGEIHFPAGYSPDNAMKAAFLMLQDVKTKDNHPVLTTCSQNSIANCLLDMVVQGLNPAKKQVYFIPYGKTLTCQRSYHGSIALVKSLCGAEDVYFEVVYEGDEFEYNITRGNKSIVKHKQSLKNIDKDNILAAYCVIAFPGDKEDFTELMTMTQLKQAWSQSAMKPLEANGDIKAGSVHGKFTEEMCIKTVVNRACKRYINSSSDSALLKDIVKRTDEARDEARFEETVALEANTEAIDIDPDTGEVMDIEEDVQEEKQPSRSCPDMKPSETVYDSACQKCKKIKGCPSWPEDDQEEEPPVQEGGPEF